MSAKCADDDDGCLGEKRKKRARDAGFCFCCLIFINFSFIFCVQKLIFKLLYYFFVFFFCYLFIFICSIELIIIYDGGSGLMYR